MEMRNFNNSFLRVYWFFQIFIKATRITEPSKCSFYHPAFWYDVKACGFNLRWNVHSQSKNRIYVSDKRTAIPGIYTNRFDCRIVSISRNSRKNTGFGVVKVLWQQVNNQKCRLCMSFVTKVFFLRQSQPVHLHRLYQ